MMHAKQLANADTRRAYAMGNSTPPFPLMWMKKAKLQFMLDLEGGSVCDPCSRMQLAVELVKLRSKLTVILF